MSIGNDPYVKANLASVARFESKRRKSVDVISDDTGLIALYMRTKDGREFEHPLSRSAADSLANRLKAAVRAQNIETKNPASQPNILSANVVSHDAGPPDPQRARE